MKQIKLVDVPKSELRMIEVGGGYCFKLGWMGADGLSGRNRSLEEPSCTSLAICWGFVPRYALT